MKNPCWALLIVATIGTGMTARLESGKSWQVAGEPEDLRFFVVNDGGKPVRVAPEFFTWKGIEISTGNGWERCGTDSITPGVATPHWKELAPGEAIEIGLGRFDCKPGASPMDRTALNWTWIPGAYRLRAYAAHALSGRALPNTDERIPADAVELDLQSNELEIVVRQPVGADADAFRWARENGTSPMSTEVLQRFPQSRYSALMLWQYIALGDRSPEEVKELGKTGKYPTGSSVPDPAGHNGWRSISPGQEMARWRIEQGERILLEHGDFPYVQDLRLSIAVSYGLAGDEKTAKQRLRDLALRSQAPGSRWAAQYMQLQGWQ